MNITKKKLFFFGLHYFIHTNRFLLMCTLKNHFFKFFRYLVPKYCSCICFFFPKKYVHLIFAVVNFTHHATDPLKALEE